MKKSHPIPLTASKLARIRSDIGQLVSQRAQILIRLHQARQMGDLSENGAYKYAKFELRRTDRRLRYLRHLSRFGVVVAKPSSANSIGFGHTVTVKNRLRTLTFTLVSQHESDPSQHKLSLSSPLGQAVIGKRVGDRVKVYAPDTTITYTIISIA